MSISTSYAAYRMGVSRRHAILMLKSRHLQIVDLGSSNGTMVNGVKLAPHQPRPLRDGDMLSLGKMGLRVIFRPRAALVAQQRLHVGSGFARGIQHIAEACILLGQHGQQKRDQPDR